MGARPLRRAIQRYIEDPLADFVLREQVPEGSTVMVDASGEQSEDEAIAPDDEVKLTVIAPKPKPTPVGVGAEGGSSPEQDSPAEEPKVPDAPQDGE
jgi:ATP-dependent Clp protease ATP-binding subunit ClpC